jgi:hypothetical protein
MWQWHDLIPQVMSLTSVYTTESTPSESIKTNAKAYVSFDLVYTTQWTLYDKRDKRGKNTMKIIYHLYMRMSIAKPGM